MSVPADEVVVPDHVLALAGGAAVVAVWRNGLGGTTFRLGTDRYVRWSPGGSGPDLEGEVARLRWAAGWLRVPHVLAHGRSGGAAWLMTAALAGRSAVDPYWLARPRQASLAVGRGLRRLHDRLPVTACPFDWSVASRSAGRAVTGLLRWRPEPDRLVVCHGDACAPNTLLLDDGALAAHVDLGRLGVADRWADLAPACWSADHNYGPGHADLVCQGYGVEPDRERLRWYQALWDAEDLPATRPG